MTELKSPVIAGGQTQRMTGASRDAALHDQLYRYAQDLQVLLEDKSELEQRYQALEESYRQLAEGRSILENMVQSSHDMHLTTTPAGTILQCNAAAGRIARASVLVGQSLRALVLPSHQADFDSLLANAQATPDESLTERELWLRGPGTGATNLIVAAKLLPIFKDGAVEAIHWMVRDLTRAREAEFDSQISSMVFRSATEGIMITDLEGDILAVNPAFSKITGYSAEEVIGRSPSILKSGVQDAGFYQRFWADLREKGQWQGEVFNRKKSGEIYPEWLAVTAARDSEGRILSYIGVFSDMSRLQEAEKQLSYIAYHDTLTGLPNRLLLLDRTRQAIAQARRGAFPLSVLFIDLDGFKQVNDSFGHEAGDRVLQETSRRLRTIVRESDTVGRLGGDEFVVVASGLGGGEDTERLAGKIIAALTQPIMVADREVSVGCSIGIASLQEGMDPETLLRQSDAAMYRAKQAGGNTYLGHEAHADGA
jgi:diguanylate cyclase (GGDEF)-like protein/PAS domain S-box-containing protein